MHHPWHAKIRLLCFPEFRNMNSSLYILRIGYTLAPIRLCAGVTTFVTSCLLSIRNRTLLNDGLLLKARLWPPSDNENIWNYGMVAFLVEVPCGHTASSNPTDSWRLNVVALASHGRQCGVISTSCAAGNDASTSIVRDWVEPFLLGVALRLMAVRLYDNYYDKCFVYRYVYLNVCK